MITKKGVIVHPDEITAFWEETVLASDINIFGIHPVGGLGSHDRVRELAEHGFPQDAASRLLNMKAHGVSVEYELHAMSMLLPRELFDKHPEYFRMNSAGERTPDFNCCASNTDALAIISDSAEKLAASLPFSSPCFNFWLDDVDDKPCRCHDCQGYSSSDQALLIYNAILRGLKRYDRTSMQSYLSYCGAAKPPVKVQPDDGIFLEFAPFRRDFRKPMTAPENAVSAKAAADTIAFFGTRGAKALEYWLDNSMFSGWKKPPAQFNLDVPVTQSDLEFYDKLGFPTVTTFACYLGDDYEKLYGRPDITGYIR